MRPKNGNVFIGAYNGTNGAVLDGQSKTTYAFHGTAHHVAIKNLIVKNYTAPTQSARADLVRFVLGERWRPAVVVLQVLIAAPVSGAR